MSKVNLIVRWIWTKFGPSGLGREVDLRSRGKVELGLGGWSWAREAGTGPGRLELGTKVVFVAK